MKKLLFILMFAVQLISKHAAAQNYSPVWVNDISAPDGAVATAIVLDKSGNVYITGRYAGTAVFNLKQGGAQTLTSNGGADIFIAKYDQIAGNFIWAIGFGGDQDEHPTDMAIGNDGSVVIEGQFQSPSINFNPKGSAILSPQGAEDIFFAKYDLNGNYIWAKSIGESGTDRGVTLAVDNNNNVFLTGVFQNTMNADPAGGNYILTSNGVGFCEFFAKYDSNGNIVWAHILPGGFGLQPKTVIAIDPNTSDVAIGGSVTGSFDFSYNGTSGGTLNIPNGSMFLATYTNDGIYKSVRGMQLNSGSVTPLTLIIGAQSDIFLDVGFSGSFYPNGLVNPPVTAVGSNDGAILSYSSSGVYNWTDHFGSANSAFYGSDICLDNLGNIVFAGSFNGSMDFDPGTAGSTTYTSQGGEYFFIAKYNQSGKNLNSTAFGGACSSNVSYRVMANSSGVYITGGFCGTVNFDPSPCNADNLTASGSPDALVAKYIIKADTVANIINTITTPADSVFCTSGDPAAILGNTPTGSGTTFTYQWQSSTNGTTFTNISGATGVSYDPPIINATTYYQRSINSSCGLSTSNIVKISISSPPSPPNNITTTTCQNSSVTITVTGQTGDTYNWYDSPAKTNLLYTGLSFTTPVLTQNTTYYIGANNGACDATSLATAQVIVIPLPAAPALVSDTVQVCTGTPATFTIANPQQGFTYNWYNQATGSTPIFTGTSFTIGITLQGTAFFAEAANSAGCISATRTEADLNLISLPNAPLVAAPTPVCSGSPEILMISDPDPTLTYQWYVATTGGTLLATGIQYTTPDLTANTTYYAQAISSSGGCPSATRTAVTVPVTPIPAPPASQVVQVCPGMPATFTIANAVTGVTYNWYDSPAITHLLFTGTTYVTADITANTTFYVEAISGLCTSPTIATFQADLIPLPASPQVNSTAVTTCSGTQITLNIVDPQTGYTYNWYTSATGGTPSGTGIDFVTPAVSQSTAYYAEAVNSNSCPSATRTPINITVSSLPDITAQSVSACPNTSAVLTAQSLDANTVINWYSSASGGSILYTGSNFTTPVLSAGTSYYAEAVDKTTQCVSAQRSVATVTILTQLPTPVVTVENTSPTQITFQWGAVPGAAAYKVSTDNGETFSDPSSGSDGLSTTISGLQLGQSVTIIVEALGSYSCQTSAPSVAVTALAQYPQNDIIYVANAFTPNGDGKNDIVYVHGNGIQSMNFHIYDQFGELIFSSSSLNLGWNGTYKGTLQPVGVYVYYVEAQMYNGQKISKKGTITLLK